MHPERKRFAKHFEPIADGIARLDIDQEVREQVAQAVADGIDAAATVEAEGGTSQSTKEWRRGWRRDLFVLIASDPLVRCAGYDDGDGQHECPHGIEIRIGMHLSSAPDGRSKAWRRRAPLVRCVSCGARQFVPGYHENAALPS